MVRDRTRADDSFARYSLLKRIGRGGMAEVWKAKIHGALDFERVVVLKRILPHLCSDPSFIEMFTAEAKLSAKLFHPNIVQVFEYGTFEDEYFLAMEYVKGVTLSQAIEWTLATQHRVPLGLAAQVVRDVCLALDYAHGLQDDQGHPLGIVHRDVSPSNVMITFDGGVKLLDFGVAKALRQADEKTRTGVLKGKVGYMAPETVEGTAESDHRADLFAAGVVLHEMIAGRRLFRGRDEIHTLALVRACDVEVPSGVRPDVPVALDEICLKALAKDPAARYASGGELAAALTGLLHDFRWDSAHTSKLVRQIGESDEERAEAPTPDVPRTPLAAKTPAPVVPVKTPPTASERPRRRIGARLIALTVGVLVTVLAVAIWARVRRGGAGGVAGAAAGSEAIIVTSQPGDAVVEVDGVAAPETTPTAVRGVAPGRHVVRVRKEGHSTIERTLVIAPRERVAVEVLLPPESRVVEVRSVPAGAQVFLDGSLAASRTPAKISVANGELHALRLEMSGYETRQMALEPEDREPVKELSLSAEKSPTGGLIVDASGTAAVWIDGLDSGFLTPTITMRLSVGQHVVELYTQGRRVAGVPANVRKGEVLRIVLPLPKETR